jgi:hypothetical protein
LFESAATPPLISSGHLYPGRITALSQLVALTGRIQWLHAGLIIGGDTALLVE